MRKTKLLVLLVLVLLVMVALKCCGEKKNIDIDEVQLSDTAQSGQEMSSQVMGKTVIPLNPIKENEGGGIIITRTKEDGTTEEFLFTDVEADGWYADAVNYVVSVGLMNGSEDGPIFLPDYGIQRLEFAIVLYRFAGGTEESFRHKFIDMETPDWYDKYVAWVTNHGYMNGKEDGSFDPFGYLSCEEALIVLYRLAGEPKPKGTLENYPYAPKVSEFGLDAVTWAWNSGLIVEQECVWYPTQTISRAQVALLFTRYSRMAESAS